MGSVGPWTLTVGVPSIFTFSIGDTINQQPGNFRGFGEAFRGQQLAPAERKALPEVG